MKRYVNMTQDCKDLKYRECCESLGEDYNPEIRFIVSPKMNKLTLDDIVMEGINCPQKILLINEAFMDNGELRNWKVNRDYGSRWIKKVIEEIKGNCQKEIWLTDMRPRSLTKWHKIREYIDRWELDLDGIGIQVHFDIGRGIIPDWLTSKAVLNYIETQTELNKKYGKVAFSEISVLPGEEKNIGKIGKIYKKIDSLAVKLNIDWLLYWTPTDRETWHWDKTRMFPCGIFDLEGNDRR